MGRKKKKEDSVKPWCYYCDREFDDETVLVQHQTAKHFKCPECNKKMGNITGLVYHLFQVHKINCTSVPNAKPDRDRTDIEIVGMRGIPDEAYDEHVAKLESSSKKPKLSHEETAEDASAVSEDHHQPSISPPTVPSEQLPLTHQIPAPSQIAGPLSMNPYSQMPKPAIAPGLSQPMGFNIKPINSNGNAAMMLPPRPNLPFSMPPPPMGYGIPPPHPSYVAASTSSAQSSLSHTSGSTSFQPAEANAVYIFANDEESMEELRSRVKLLSSR